MYCTRNETWLTGVITVMCAMTLFGHSASASPIDDAVRERVSIQAGDVVLGATLYRPAGSSGDLPAIVTAHGSAPSTREGVGFYTDRALGMGFAVLSFDKRGTGESTGTYDAFSVENSSRIFHELAMDVVWSARWLADQGGIDQSRIGLFGGSQAGWIMPLAASLLDRSNDPTIRFIIIGEGVSVSAGEEAVHEEYLDSLGIPGEELTASMFADADEVLYAHTGERGFDPVHTLNSIDTPTLWIFGLRDWVVPIVPSINRLADFIDAEKQNNDIHVFPFGDHNFTNVVTGERYDVQGVSQAWLIQIGVLDGE
jgi:dienelactone hydrolase